MKKPQLLLSYSPLHPPIELGHVRTHGAVNPYSILHVGMCLVCGGLARGAEQPTTIWYLTASLLAAPLLTGAAVVTYQHKADSAVWVCAK